MVNRRWLQWGIASLFTLVLVVGAANPAYAQGLPPRDNIPQGETVQGDAFLYGDVVKVNGDVTGDLFIVGRDVTVAGNVSGSLYILAQNASITGEVGGSLYAAGANLGQGQKSVVRRHAYLLGVTFYADPGSTISGDLSAAIIRAWLSGNIGGRLNAVILILNVTGTVGDSPTATALAPKVNGLFSLIQLASPPPDDWFSPFPSAPAQEENGLPTSIALLTFLWEFLRRLATYLLIGGVVIWLLPGQIENSAAKLRTRPWASMGWGFLVFFVGYLLMAVLAIAIPIIAYQLWKITLWGLASILIALGFSLLGVAFSFLTITILYGTKLVLAWLIGKWIVGFSSSKTLQKPIWPMLIGIIIVTLLRTIPTIGGILGLIATVLGLGAIWLSLAKSTPKQAAGAVPEIGQELAA